MPAVKIKICGITRAADAEAAARLGADAIGLNFYTASPRYLDPNLASVILRGLPPFLSVAAVFVNEKLPTMIQISRQIGKIGIIQWHGDNLEPGDPGPFKLVPAFAIKDRSDLDRINKFLDASRATGIGPDALLLDAHDPERFGGTGRTAPWELIAAFHPGLPIILAGGLTPENVTEAIRIVRPYAVDVASGVESQPGVKDEEKMARFIAAVRSI
jgi:phosphoribosylanthranilate isomerase